MKPGKIPNVPPSSEQPATTVRRDLAIVAAAVAVAAVVTVHFEVSEALQRWASAWERYQLDEFPVIALVAAVSLAWFVWRRIGEVRAELARRIAAERALESALAENRRLSQTSVRLQEDERRRLARELHDELGQHLNAIKLEAVTLRRDADGEEVRRGAESIAAGADHLHAIVRDMTRALRPAGLDELGLAAALENYVEGWKDKAGARVSLDIAGELEGLPEEVNITVYRFIQEALTNVARHARARHATIRVERGASAVSVTLEDDGAGAPSPWTSGGVGLIGMRERVESLGGSMQVVTAPDRGFSVAATVPVAGAMS
ncbi:MAG TPA: sensor histidine kinase [Burkholderiales bacterium]|nr:sensor histidine kinase [Burkholderiales bacterium]